MLVGSAFIESEGERLCNELLDRGLEVTAIVAGNDLMALGCYDVFVERGIDCPREISVVGYNDMPFAGWFPPPLTTVHLPHYEIGVRAAELLLAQLRDPTRAGPGAARSASWSSAARPRRRRPAEPSRAHLDTRVDARYAAPFAAIDCTPASGEDAPQAMSSRIQSGAAEPRRGAAVGRHGRRGDDLVDGRP